MGHHPINFSKRMNNWDRFYIWLDTDLDRAETEYKSIRQALIPFFQNRKCADAEGLADKTIERVVNVLPKFGDSLPVCPLRYSYGVARFIYKEYLREESTRNDLDLSELPFDPPDQADNEDREVMDRCLNKCLQKLDDRKREVFTRYYLINSVEKSIYHQSMANHYGVTITALRLQILRIKEKLRACIRACLQHEARA